MLTKFKLKVFGTFVAVPVALAIHQRSGGQTTKINNAWATIWRRQHREYQNTQHDLGGRRERRGIDCIYNRFKIKRCLLSAGICQNLLVCNRICKILLQSVSIYIYKYSYLLESYSICENLLVSQFFLSFLFFFVYGSIC